ncbi:MAG TPA: hypothetical protein VGM63_08915 [Mucilaginibacter sp.]|jgi:hypothetical protein
MVVRNVEGASEKLNDVFTVRFDGGTFVIFKVTESIPGEKIAWLVTDCYLPWLKDKTEWKKPLFCLKFSFRSRDTGDHDAYRFGTRDSML